MIEFHKGDIIAINSIFKPEYTHCVIVSNEKRRQHINSSRSMEVKSYFSPENLKYYDIEPIREIEYGSELTVQCKESPKSYHSDGDR